MDRIEKSPAEWRTQLTPEQYRVLREKGTEALFSGALWDTHESGMEKKGFTIVEILVVIAIIAVLATVATVTLGTGRDKGRDAKRKADLAQIGRFMAGGCFLPDDGAGTYDLAPLLDEVKAKSSQAAQLFPKAPRDPKTGTATQTNYKYVVSDNGGRCALYANLEYASEDVTLGHLTEPTPGGGTGVLQAGATGWNGTNRYYQTSN